LFATAIVCVSPPAASVADTRAQATTIEELIQASDYNPAKHAEILRLYKAFFNREPDIAGAKYWIQVSEGERPEINSPRATIRIAQAFPGASAEFRNLYGANVSDEDFLTRVYQNVLLREPDPVGYGYWLDKLKGTNNSGLNPTLGKFDSRGGVVFYVALDTEFVNRADNRYGQDATADGRFEDQFEQALGDGWTWLNEDPSRWSLTERAGWLTIITNSAFPPVNQLLRPMPTSAYTIETQLRFAPNTNFQFAGLIVQGEEPDNLLQFGRAYCNAPGLCVGDGLYFDHLVDGNPTGSNYPISVGDPTDVFLRLTFDGEMHSAYYSNNGVDWILAGEHRTSFTAIGVGVVAHQGDGLPADFAYFTIIEGPPG
jgi:hypothetical protein